MMERLISWNKDCVEVNGHVLYNVTWEDIAMMADRLARYEDTKRTPEQIEALEAAIMGKAVAQITEFEGLPIARLRELAVADQEGRVVVLPDEDFKWTIRGDIALGIIKANCRVAKQAELEGRNVQ